ncbi:MAG: aromatic compound degradation protein PaaI [Chloroflexi bacterium]|nr:MAG: aromatic compound degradation protein PaaI [Chloroflexota bacterium]
MSDSLSSDQESNSTPTRSRTITWEDPQPEAEARRHMSGLAFLQSIISGELPAPPIAATLGFRLAEVAPGQVVFVVQPAEYHYNPIGVVHGGLAATLLDSCMSCAVQSTLPAGVGYTTLELKVNFIRPITLGTGELRAEGAVVHAGGKTATAEGRLLDQAGKLYAHGTTTCIILRS